MAPTASRPRRRAWPSSRAWTRSADRAASAEQQKHQRRADEAGPVETVDVGEVARVGPQPLLPAEIGTRHQIVDAGMVERAPAHNRIVAPPELLHDGRIAG